jgi:hypothetical protein
MMDLTPLQKIILWCAAAIGLFGINGLFLYSMAVRPWEMKDIQTNWYALAFMLEAFLLLPLFCYLIAIAKFKSPGWKTFLILSLLGSLAFSIPFSILMWNRNAQKS